MKPFEFAHLLGAIIVLTLVIGFASSLSVGPGVFAQALFFSALIILVAIAGKKLMAHLFEMDVEHRIWTWSRWGIRKQDHLKKPMPAGIILPLIVTLFTLGTVKLMTLLTFETTARKTRAARRFGTYNYVSTTDWHNALVGAAGVISILLLALVNYFVTNNNELLSKMATYYAVANLLPLSDLDGTHIFFGSRVLYTALAAITLVFFGYALFLG